jgi:hypothetical protein
MIIVYEINGQLWRAYRQSHGGYGGETAFQYRSCGGQLDTSAALAQLSPRRIELVGMVLIPNCDPDPPNPPGVFTFDAFNDTTHWISHYLNFGTNYQGLPGGGHTTCVVGGLVERPLPALPWVIVYEMDGEFFREPGDTTALVPLPPSSTPGPAYLGSPTTYLTARNFPNPFNPTTTIAYSVPTAGGVTVKVFDITGREVAVLVNGYQSAGTYAVAWNGANAASGIYFYRVMLGSQSFTNRMVLMK